MADSAQNIQNSQLSDLGHSSSAQVDEVKTTAYRASSWLVAAFARHSYIFSISCILLFALAGAAFTLLFSQSSQAEKLTQIRIQFDTTSVPKFNLETLMTVAQNAVLSDAGRAELARQIINDGLVLSSAPQTTWWGLFSEVAFGKARAPSDPVLRARHDMRNRITLSQSADRSALFVSTYAETSDASARFAQHAANRIVSHINASRPADVKGNTDKNRAIFEKAEAAVTGFQVRYGADAMAKMETTSQDLALVSRSVEELERRLADASRNLSNLAALQGDKALGRKIPDDAAFLPLQDAVRQYAAASNTLAQLSVQYGPKHPHVIAVTQTLRETKANAARVFKHISNESKQTELAAKTELTQVRNRQTELEKDLAVFGDAPQELQKLEAELTQAREAYFNSFNGNGQQSTHVAGPFAVANAPLAVNIQPNLRQMLSLAVMGGGCGLIFAFVSLGVLHVRMRARQAVVAAEDVRHDPDVHERVGALPVEATALIDETCENPSDIEEDFAMSDAHDQHYGFAANDMPLDERVREVLMRKSIRTSQQDTVQIPTTLAAAMQGRFEIHSYDEPDEVSEVRRDIAVLRQRLQDYANRRVAHSA